MGTAALRPHLINLIHHHRIPFSLHGLLLLLLLLVLLLAVDSLPLLLLLAQGLVLTVTSPEARVQQESRMSSPFLFPSAFTSTGDLGLLWCGCRD